MLLLHFFLSFFHPFRKFVVVVVVAPCVLFYAECRSILTMPHLNEP